MSWVGWVPDIHTEATQRSIGQSVSQSVAVVTSRFSQISLSFSCLSIKQPRIMNYTVFKLNAMIKAMPLEPAGGLSLSRSLSLATPKVDPHSIPPVSSK